jgi:crotonobetaine/carnitine-CoA ligase
MIKWSERYSEWKYKKGKRTVGYILEDKAKKCFDKNFIRFKDGPWITFGEVNETVNKIANGLSSIGVKKGDNVGIMSPNCMEFIYGWFALAKLGAVEVPISVHYKGEWLRHAIDNTDLKAIIIDEQFLDRIKFIQTQLRNPMKLVLMPGRQISKPASNFPQYEVYSYEDFLTCADTPPQVDVNYYDPICIMYTSGTTGLSKGVICSHHFYYTWAELSAKIIRATSEDIYFVWSPLFHQTAQAINTFSAMIHEAKVVLVDRFSASTFWDDLRKYEITTFWALGQLIPIMMSQAPKPNDRDHKVRVVFGFPAPPDLHEDFEKRYGVKLTHSYGLTEGCVPIQTLYEEHKVGTVGKVLEDLYEVKIVDEHDDEVPPNVKGEIVIRSKEPWTMYSGYYNMPEEEAKINRNFWFHTGDGGYRDENGYFYFVDRIKDAIRRRGENISAYEVEKVLNQHPAVLESAAVGVRSEVGEEEVKIVVVLRPDQKLTPEKLFRYCEPRMPYFAIPRYIVFRGSLPKTPTEKVQKYKLREEGITDDAWDREKAGIKLKK